MALFGTEPQRLSNLIKITDAPFNLTLFTDQIVINDATAPNLVVGTVLGKVTGTGKYKVCLQGAVDGSQVPAAIYIADNFGNNNPLAVVASTDTTIVALTRGKLIVNSKALALDASFTAGALTTGAYNSLKAVGILVETGL